MLKVEQLTPQLRPIKAAVRPNSVVAVLHRTQEAGPELRRFSDHNELRVEGGYRFMQLTDEVYLLIGGE